MKILVSANSPHVNSGYGLQVREFIARWSRLGHKYVMRANSSLGGAPYAFPVSDTEAVRVLPVDPGGTHGNDIFMADAAYYKVDLLKTLHDVWPYQPEKWRGLPWMAWFPVDHDPLPRDCRTVLQQCDFPVVLSRDGQEICKAAGIEAAYVPHGIDTTIYTPGEQEAARLWINDRDSGPRWTDAFIVGLLGANKGTPSRKALEPQVRAFKAFWDKYPDSKLAIHSALVADENIMEMCRVIDLPSDALLVSNQYEYTAGLLDQEYMVNWFRAIDVLSHATMGEGFGLAIIEAQACGTPVIVTDFSAMPEKLFAGWKVPAAHKLWTYQHSYQAIPDVEAITESYEKAYTARGDETLKTTARQGIVEHYDSAMVTEEYWKPLLELVEDKLTAKPQFSIPKPGRRVSVVTLWHNHPEYIDAYEQAVQGADEIIIIDNGSDEATSAQLFAMVERLRGVYHKNHNNVGFGAGNNQGVALATGDIILLLNNDIAAAKPGWLNMVREIRTGAIYGQSQGFKLVDNQILPYIEGWAMAMRREIWNALNGFDSEHYPFGYWEDSDLCYRAMQLGYGMTHTEWGLLHIGGGTSRDYPDEFVKRVEENYLTFVRRVRDLPLTGNGLHDEDALRAYARGIVRGVPEIESEAI